MTASYSIAAPRAGFTARQYAICFMGIVWRESLRFLHQGERFISALVRPLLWLFIFAAGFRQVLGVSIIPPYDTYVLYEVYITPGLVAMRNSTRSVPFAVGSPCWICTSKRVLSLPRSRSSESVML